MVSLLDIVNQQISNMQKEVFIVQAPDDSVWSVHYKEDVAKKESDRMNKEFSGYQVKPYDIEGIEPPKPINAENLKAAGINNSPGYRHGRYDTDVYKVGNVKVELDYLHVDPKNKLQSFSPQVGEMSFEGVTTMRGLMNLIAYTGDIK